VKSSTDLDSEHGSAIVDLIGFGVLLQIPILMFATFAVSIQQQSFAVESIARHALRVHSLWPVLESTQEVVTAISKDFGINPERVNWTLVCSPNPNCLEPNTVARIEVRYGDLVAYANQRF
jgi:hypothetical protein